MYRVSTFLSKNQKKTHTFLQLLFRKIEEQKNWVHMSLCYGDELPKSFDLGELNELIPITISFDTLSLYKTGPNISEWKEITTLRLN